MIPSLKIPEINEAKKDLHKVYQSTFIDVTKPIQKQPICLSYGVNYDEYTPIVSYGNFACLVGASKSMKTFLKTAFTAGYLGGKSTQYFSELRGHNEVNKFVVDFDTEQGSYHVQKSAKRVVSMVGSATPYYKPFALRALTPKERVEFIEWVFYESNLKNDIGFCTIDGVADLLDNVNDLDKSNEITQKLMKITEEKNVGMITVIHKNYESLKPTGHLGSAILKKAETVLFVDREDNIANVKAKYSRNVPIEDFSFSVNEKGIPEQIDNNIF